MAFLIERVLDDYDWYVDLLKKYNLLLKQGDRSINIGEVVLPPSGLLVEFLDVWSSYIDSHIDDEITAQQCDWEADGKRLQHFEIEFNACVEELHYERGITYEEYLAIKKGEVEMGGDQRSLMQRIVRDQVVLHDLEISRTGYMKCVQQLDLECWTEFLQGLAYTIPYKEMRTHGYIVSKTRAGKSELMKVIIHKLQELRQQDSIILIDPHGDLCQEVKNFAINHQNPERVIYFDPFFKSGHTPIFNPLDIADKSEDNIHLVTQQLIIGFKELFRDFPNITGAMESLLTYCLPVLLKKEDSNLHDLVRFMQDDPELIALGQASSDKNHATYFRGDFQREKRSSKEAVARRLLKVLGVPSFSRMVSGRNTFDLEEAMNSGKIILFNISASMWDTDQTELFGRFLISYIKSIAMKRGQISSPKNRPVTFLFLDEFQHFISPSLEKMVSQLAKQHLHLFVAHQYTKQVDDRLLSSIINNAHVKIAGVAGSDTYAGIADYIQISKQEQMANLKRYHFYVKAGDQQTVLIKSSDELLDQENYLTKEQQEELDQYFLERYYIPIQQAPVTDEINPKYGFDD